MLIDTRYATAGEASVDNIQIFSFRFHDMQFGLAHNGIYLMQNHSSKNSNKEAPFSLDF